MLHHSVFILISILSHSILLTASDGCNWMNCYSSELKECVPMRDRDECRAIFIEYREAPLFLLKSKCCLKWTLQSIEKRFLCNFKKANSIIKSNLSTNLLNLFFLDCVKTIQNATHICRTFAEEKIEISTRNNCNRFGCKTVQDKNKVIQPTELMMSATESSTISSNITELISPFSLVTNRPKDFNQKSRDSFKLNAFRSNNETNLTMSSNPVSNNQIIKI